jgi:hypothetical protein
MSPDFLRPTYLKSVQRAKSFRSLSEPRVTGPTGEVSPWAFEHRDLVPQGKHFHGQSVPRSDGQPQENQNHPEKFKDTTAACAQILAK